MTSTRLPSGKGDLCTFTSEEQAIAWHAFFTEEGHSCSPIKDLSFEVLDLWDADAITWI